MVKELLFYLLIASAGVVAAFFARRLPASGKYAVAGTLVTVAGYYFAQVFC